VDSLLPEKGPGKKLKNAFPGRHSSQKPVKKVEQSKGKQLIKPPTEYGKHGKVNAQEVAKQEI
jgi:hypothetical protein